MIQTIHSHSISGFCSDMFPVSKMRWAFLRRWVGQKLLNMLTYVGNDWSGYNIYYIAMKKTENALDIGRSASDGSNSLVKTPLHLIRWGSKTSGLSSTLNYAWSFEVAHFSEEGWRLLWKDLGIPWISLAKWFPPQMYDPTLAFLVVHSSPTKGPALNSCACSVDWNISWWMPLPGFFSVSKRISCFWVFRSMPSFFWYNSWSFPIQFTWLNWTSPNRKRLNMHKRAIAGRIITFLAQ